MPTDSRQMPVLGALLAAAAMLYVGRREAPSGHTIGRRLPAATPLAGPQLTAGSRLMPRRIQWGHTLANVWAELSRDHISVMAAGVAFYGLLSIFPAMSALISIY